MFSMPLEIWWGSEYGGAPRTFILDLSISKLIRRRVLYSLWQNPNLCTLCHAEISEPIYGPSMKVGDDRYLTKWGSLTMNNIWLVMSFRSFHYKVYCLFTAQRQTVKMFSSHEMQASRNGSEVFSAGLLNSVILNFLSTRTLYLEPAPSTHTIDFWPE